MAKANTLTLRCAEGHVQRIRYPEDFGEDAIHDLGVMLAGGKLRSIGVQMPGYPCAWATGNGPPCGAKVTFELSAEPIEH